MNISKDEPMKSKIHGYTHYRNLPDVMRLHLHDDSIEMISEDELEIKSLPDIMKLHFQPRQIQQSNRQHHHEERSDEPRKVHVQDRVRNLDILGQKPKQDQILTSKQIRNRRTNLGHRANRYRHEIIRQCYSKFTINQVKRIVKSMNIDYKNINMVRHKLFIGSNKEDVDEVERQLSNRIFTEQHYRRL